DRPADGADAGPGRADLRADRGHVHAGRHAGPAQGDQEGPGRGVLMGTADERPDAGQLAAALCEWLDRTAAPPTTDEPAVLVRDLSHTFGEGEKATRVLLDIHLSVRPGEIVIMTGPSGCGKTTLLTLMGGLRRLWEGVAPTCDLRINGRSLRGLSDA